VTGVQTCALPISSTPPPLPLQAQADVPGPVTSEADKVAQSSKPQVPGVQPPGSGTPLSPQTPGPVEARKPDLQTQATSQAQQIPPSPPTFNVDARATRSAAPQYRQPEQPSSVPQGSSTSQLPQPSPLRPGARVSQPASSQYQQQKQAVPGPQAPQMPSGQAQQPQRPIQQMPGQVQQSQPILARPEQRKPKRTPWYIFALVALLVLVVGGGLLGAFLFNKGKVAPTATGGSNNRVFFQDGTWHNDQLRINMQNVPPPPDGQTYFAWLQDTAQHSRPLGALPVSNGSILFLYPGDGKTNLLSVMQGVLITTEDVGMAPQAPSDHKVYQASFDPQLLEGLKSLLYATPGLPDQQSVVAAILDTLHSIDDKAGSVVDSLNTDNALAIRQATRILELLDNTQQAQSSGDLPAKYPPQLNITIGLRSSPSQAGYLDILDTQLKQLEPLVANDSNAQQHLSNVESALGDLRDWLQKTHDYDVQLLKAANLQDPATSSIALQLKQIVADSFTGRTIPPNASPLPVTGSAGAQQAYTEAQYIAALTLQPV